MSGTPRAGGRLLARPAVLRTFALGLVGRLGYGVLPLSFLFTVRQATGSFPAASGAVAVLGLGTLAMPLQARALDRWGQRRVLPLLTGSWVLALLAAVALSLAAVAAPAAWLVAAVPLGLLAPALGPSMRAQWRWFTEGTDLRARVYSLDTVAEEVLYLVGPVLAAGLLAVGPARWGLVLVAGLATAGTAALAVSPAAVARAETGASRGSLAGPVRRPGMPRLLATMACFGAGSALTLTGVAAAADGAGHPSWAGAVEAGIATGSVVGGLLWASGRRVLPAVRVLLLGCATLLAVAAAAPFWVAAALLAVGGLAWAPTFIEAFQAADRLAPEEQRTEASTLVNTATNLASALGTALTGAVVAAGASPYLPAAVVVAGAALLAGWRARGR
ncbi:MFS transporter [Nocardioides sp. T2.26MG-1]|uniref:MFS transporter n=1 Tax=Nocardioides sp. T2.26MG-1 TaxID=3041166 RepID=UPI002477C04E|nr:MFS transporter [Nocardioides sp. T2.26MG-1]CAI9401730.1 hypothetical protein HIDPHFAB_00668 [Nocardioides sp. T2.26MG-1]